MKCPTCGGDQLQTEFKPEGLRHTCKACSTTFSAAAVAPVVRPVSEQPIAPPQPKPPPSKLELAPVAAPNLSQRDLVREAKMQLKAMNAEIARLAKLIEKRDELKRLLDAASNKPKKPAKAGASRS